MKPILIDMSDYVVSGEGANGVSYNHVSDPDVMLKMYFPGKVQQPIDEYNVANKVFQTGIPTPEPGDLVTDGERVGIRFRRLRGKVSFARAIGDNPSAAADYAVDFARMCRELHATHVDTADFENVKDRYLRLLADNPFFDAPQKEKIADFIRKAPDSDTAIHGDLQFGNALIVGQERYFIDLGDFCYGYPMFDLGMVYATTYVSDEAFIQEAFHMDKATAKRFFDAFLPAYFGPDADLDAALAELKIYAGLKTLIVERDTRRPMHEFRALLEGVIY